MKKKIGLLLAVVMVMNTVATSAFAAWQNPLKKYNLYDDVMGNSVDDGSRERVMDEFNSNSLRAGGSGYSGSAYDNPNDFGGGFEAPKSRNEDLRESSRNVYSDPEATPGWEEGPSFYPNPSFDSIIAKYKKSDFAGCLQECISYVRLHPNDTLGFYYLAMCYTKVSDKDNAIMAYEKVISLNEHPMIVKYATNGRNCVMGNDGEKCYPNVNEPELVYPYLRAAQTMDLTPVDPEQLVNRNLSILRSKLSVVEDNEKDKDNSKSKNGKDKKPKIVLPFGDQDEKLDQFINAPYGNGLSPELDKQYKQLQLKKIKDTINTGNDSEEKKMNDWKDIKNFDGQKSDAGTIKLAYAPSEEYEKLSKDPEYIRQKQQLEELNMLLGNDRNSNSDDMMDLLMSEQGDKKLSPEVIQSMMMKSMMNGLTL